MTFLQKIIRSSVLIFLMTFVMSSCTHDFGDYSVDTKEQAKQNAKNLLGIDITDNTDWKMTSSYTVTVNANAPLDDIVEVKLLTAPPFNNDSARILNSTSCKSGDKVKLVYDAPDALSRIYAACVSSAGQYYIKGFKPGTQEISFVATETKALTRAGDVETGAGFKITTIARSYNAVRQEKAAENASIAAWANAGWQDERICKLDGKEEEKLFTEVPNFAEDDALDLKEIIFSFLKPGKQSNNLPKILESEIFSLNNNTLTSNGRDPLKITPVYMPSTEIGKCHLYYYYYNPAQTAGMTSEQEADFIRALPKFKGAQLQRTKKLVGEGLEFARDEVFKKHTYTLLYFGDEPIEKGTLSVSSVFPKGYKIGFMLRKMGVGEDAEKNYLQEKNGETYGDGRLNREINSFKNHFASAGMGPSDPRIAMFGANGKSYMTFEDGSDKNFSDMVIEITSGIENIDEIPDLLSQMYTYIYEDRTVGDYDMNDVVIRAQRVDETHVKYTVLAAGAVDKLYVSGIGHNILNRNVEIHEIVTGDASHQTFINTTGSMEWEPVSETIEVQKDFSLAESGSAPVLTNMSEGYQVRIAGPGEDPHAVMIPYGFKWPLEKVMITNATDRCGNNSWQHCKEAMNW